MVTALYFPLLAIVCGLRLQVRGAQNVYKIKPLAVPSSGFGIKKEYDTKYFDVKVDHFDSSNVQTFSMKYLINKNYWDQNQGPIFFLTGGESKIEGFCENAGLLWDIAKDFNAAIVCAEHRYYGYSLPFGFNEYSVDHKMAYLTVKQALEDYANLVWFLWNQNHPGHTYSENKPGPNPVVAFGGSYSGMLAAWLRMKYPGTFRGAIASSAPVNGFPGMSKCNTMYDTASSVYAATSCNCGLTIFESWDAIGRITQSVDGMKWLSKNWKLKDALTKDEEVRNLETWLISLYLSVAEGNYPYPAELIVPLPANPVEKLCESMTDPNQCDEKLLLSVFNGINVFFNYTGKSNKLNYYDNYGTHSDAVAWDFQSCTEMVFADCSEGDNDMFPLFDWDDNKEYCHKSFGVQPDHNIMKNTYGGKNLNGATNIIFSNGLLDPWHGRGVLKDISNTVLAVLIENAAHHLDLMGSNDKDPKSVIDARIIHKNWIKLWIK